MNFIKQHKWILLSVLLALLVKPLLSATRTVILPLLVLLAIGLFWFPFLFWFAATTVLNIYFGGILKRLFN